MRDSGNQLQSTREIPGDSRTAIITRLAENIPSCCTESCDIGTFDPLQLETIGLAANPPQGAFPRYLEYYEDLRNQATSNYMGRLENTYKELTPSPASIQA